MSVQTALLAGTAGLSAMSSIAGGNARAAGLGAQAWGQRAYASQLEAQGAEIGVQTQQEELQRRIGLSRLLSANRADIAGRGVDSGQGTSFDVIEGYNRDQTEKDVSNIRFMGEAQRRRLSFAADNANMTASSLWNMADQSRTQGWMSALRTIGMAAYSFGPTFGGGGGSAVPNSPMDGSFVSTT